MKYFLWLLTIISTHATGQQPVYWSFMAKKTAGKTYEIHLTATLQNGWHTYSQTTPEGGPVATKINFKNNPLLITEGVVKEQGNMIQKHEDVFGVDVKYFTGKVDFVQIVKVKAKVKTMVTGTIEYMVCTDERCLPPVTIPFNVSLQ